MARHNRLSARPGNRSSNASTPAPRSAPQTNELPPHKKPTHPLSIDAQDQLNALNGRDIARLKEHNERAGKLITEAAALVNDKLREREEHLAKRRKKWEKGIDTDDQEDEEEKMARLRENVNEATRQLEEGMRAVIDGGVAARRIEESLEWLRSNAPGRLQTDFATQTSQRQSQRQSQSQRRRRTQDEDGDEDMDEDEEPEGPTPGPTPLDRSRPVLTGPSDLFTDHVTRKKNEYTSISLRGRYAKNNSYIGFKRIVHDARYQDDHPLPNPDTWFTETGVPNPGITDPTGDDDDLVMDRATVSTRCPLTFQQFKEPYSSVKCPHTFEKTAILDMIRKSNVKVGVGRHGQRAVECPVTGCSQMLTSADLHHDPVLIRKIKRMQEAEALEDEESEAEDDVPQSSHKDKKPVSSSRPQVQLKRERSSTIVEDTISSSADQTEGNTNEDQDEEEEEEEEDDEV